MPYSLVPGPRRLGRLGLPALTVALAALAISAASSAAVSAPPPGQSQVAGSPPCSTAAGLDEQTASTAALAQCGITRVALSATVSLPGGGVAYQYDLGNGQVISFPQTPSGFNALTASAQEDQAYGVPSAPPIVAASSYEAWTQQAENWQLDPGGAPFIYVDAAQNTLGSGTDTASTGDAINSPAISYPSGPYWAGYVSPAGNWTTSEIQYYEPPVDSTSCANAGDAFWTGIGGYNDSDLGQDGTGSGYGQPANHTAWFEVLPSASVPFQNAGRNVSVSVGDEITAITDYGEGTYSFTLMDNLTPYYADENGGYNGTSATADWIVERPDVGGHVPLLNFGTVDIEGFEGTGHSYISPSSTQIQMTNFSTTSGLSDGGFTVTQHNCAG